MSHNGLEADIRKRYASEPDGAFAGVSDELLAGMVFHGAGGTGGTGGKSDGTGGTGGKSDGTGGTGGRSDGTGGASGKVNSRAFAELQSRFADMMLAKIAGARFRGTDAGDLMQECSLGLLRAARDYDPGKGASFATYASRCVDNRIRDSLRSAAAKKNSPTESIDELAAADTSELTDPLPDPESRFIIEESVDELKAKITSRLTAVENAVFFDYFHGYSYDQISRRQGITSKAVDNALQRARRKLKSLLGDSAGADGS